MLEPLGRLSGPIHVYGEMVAVLWDAGQVAAAVELEARWNALASRFTFALLCGYPATSLAAPAAAEEVARLHHGVLGPPEPTRSPGPVTHVARFAADLAELARARRFVASSLPGIGEEAEAEATLIVTELAANAVVHAGSRFSVRLGIAHRQLWIAVQDGAGLPAPLAPTPGRGLGLVAALAERWGCERLGRGKVVWASLPLTREMPAPAPGGTVDQRPGDLTRRRASAPSARNGWASASSQVASGPSSQVAGKPSTRWGSGPSRWRRAGPPGASANPSTRWGAAAGG